MNAPTACEINPASASSPGRYSRSRSRYRLDALVLPAIVLALLAGTLFGGDRLAFRDVSHFYMPLYKYVAQRASEQWLPLWNDRCQTGMPLVGETTTAVLYPIRYLVFSLPLSAERQMAWYVALHLILASFFARIAAARAGALRAGQMVAGLTYPLSGTVFFLYCNPPFLVSAAWLPLALSMLIQPNGDRRSKRILLSAITLAMMILGGDPQTALHVALITLAVYGLQSLKRRKISGDFIILVASLVLTVGLSAPQIAASISWSLQSDRIHDHAIDGLQYCIPPWHFAELLTANGSGSLFPIYRRISNLIPGDGRMWTATLFMGMLPALMLLDRMTRWRRRSEDLWLIIALAAAACAVGHFGIVWWIQWLTGAMPIADSAVGGAYWLLLQMVPGYDAFRYPAKWLPFFAIGMSVACGVWFERMAWIRAYRAWWLALAIVLSASVAILLIPIKPSSPIVDEFWGPLDVAGARIEIAVSLLFSILSLMILGCIYLKWRRVNPYRAVCFAIVVLAFELTYSASRQIATVSIADERAWVKNDQQSSPPNSLRLLRMQSRSDSTWPTVWKQESDPDRISEVESFIRPRLFGRWHLESNHSVVNNFVSIRSQHQAMFWSTIMQAQQDHQRIDWNTIQRWLAVDAVLKGPNILPLESKESESPKIQIFDQWRPLSPSDANEDAVRVRFMEIIEGKTETPVFLSDSDLVAESAFVGGTQPTSPECLIIRESAQETLLVVKCSKPVLVVRPTFQDGHWFAEIQRQAGSDDSWRSIEVGQADFIKQGTQVPPGCWEIRFRYHPWWLSPTLCSFVIAWIAVSYALAHFVRGGLRTRNSH